MSNRRRDEIGRAAYDGATRVLAVAMIVIGALLVVRGAVLGVVLGVGLVGAGAGRLWILARLRRPR
jgi:preprotein translocase subunit SecY